MTGPRNDESALAWPVLGQTAFDKAPDWIFNACVGWARGNMELYVEGYTQAATALFEQVASRHSGQDVLVFPIAFMWRQVLELRLKQIIWLGCELDGRPGECPMHHDLVRLWSKVRALLPQLGADPHSISAVDRIIGQFNQIDPTSSEFRYPMSRQATPSLPQAPSHVNLRNLHEVMEGVANFLSCAVMEQSHQLDVQRQR